MDTCPFCSVLKDDKNNQIIEKGEHVTAIRKQYKSRNVNFLIISNIHHDNLKNMDDTGILKEIVCMANKLSKGRDWSMTINNGKNSRQTVFHLHAHISSDEDSNLWF